MGDEEEARTHSTDTPPREVAVPPVEPALLLGLRVPSARSGCEN